MDGSSAQQHRETEMFRIQPHQSSDFARHLSEYHGWSFCSKMGGSFELTPPAHKKLPDEIEAITEVNISQFFQKNFMEYETIIRVFIESVAATSTRRKKRKAALLNTTAEAMLDLGSAGSPGTTVRSPPTQKPCTWATCSSIATCESKFKQPRCMKHKYFRACEIIGCTAKARDGDAHRKRCIRHRKAMQCAFPDCRDSVTHTFGDKVTCRVHKDCVENNIVEEDPLVQLIKEKEKVVNTMKLFFESKSALGRLKDQAIKLKSNHDRILQSKKEVVYEVDQIKKALNIEMLNLENLKRSHEANEKRFQEALKGSDLKRLHKIQENVSQSWKDVSESQLKIYATEVTLVEKNSALFDLQLSKQKFKTHEAAFEKAKKEFKTVCAGVHKVRVEENMLVAKLMLK